MDIEKLAEAAGAAFVTGHRTDGEAFRKVADDAPEWITDLVRDAAHAGGKVFPNDWRYECVEDCLTAIAGGSEDAPEGDIYTKALLAWFSGDPDALDYCDRAAEEGYVSADASMLDRITAGQALLIGDIFAAVVDTLNARAEED